MQNKNKHYLISKKNEKEVEEKKCQVEKMH